MAPSKALVEVQEDLITVINPEQSLKAAKALVKHMKKAAADTASKESKRNPLDDEDQAGASALADTPIVLQVSTKTFFADTNRLKAHTIELPHPLHTVDSDISICLITADPQRGYKDIVASDAFPEAVRNRIGRVIGFSKLKAKFSQYEAQRQLYSSHDMFLADSRIISRLPKVLGKTFYKSTAKRPLSVSLQPALSPEDKKLKRVKEVDGVPVVRAREPEHIAKEVEKIMGQAPVHLGVSNSTAVKLGYADWDPENIAANVDVVMKTLAEKYVPKKWKNVRSFYLKGPQTAALPVWLTEELWLDENSVAPGGEEAKSIEEPSRANIKKKRKSREQATEVLAQADAEAEEPARKKKKRATGDKDAKDEEAKEAVQQISTSRKSKLKKQKEAARKSMD